MIGERQELGHGAYIDHARGFLASEAAANAFAQLRGELSWEAREIVLFGRRILQPRLIAWGGPLPYRYSGQTLPPRPLPPCTAALLGQVTEQLGVPFNHVLANLYRNGDDSMGMHADAEPELGVDPVVATLSLGATRRMRVAPRKGVDGAPRDIELGAGDLLVMGGTCQRYFLHGIPRVRSRGDLPGEAVAERISLTLRDVKRAPVT
ncbi:MAG TPA: alpha-ketoglutarate-dependent dioxygenase AlkB [Polyangia bacterium]